jgi:hypothetical protein
MRVIVCVAETTGWATARICCSCLPRQPMLHPHAPFFLAGKALSAVPCACASGPSPHYKVFARLARSARVRVSIHCPCMCRIMLVFLRARTCDSTLSLHNDACVRSPPRADVACRSTAVATQRSCNHFVTNMQKTPDRESGVAMYSPVPPVVWRGKARAQPLCQGKGRLGCTGAASVRLPRQGGGQRLHVAPVVVYVQAC